MLIHWSFSPFLITITSRNSNSGTTASAGEKNPLKKEIKELIIENGGLIVSFNITILFTLID